MAGENRIGAPLVMTCTSAFRVDDLGSAEHPSTSFCVLLVFGVNEEELCFCGDLADLYRLLGVTI
jgi:hypothetical protein